jgi:hypothetical protein
VSWTPSTRGCSSGCIHPRPIAFGAEPTAHLAAGQDTCERPRTAGRTVGKCVGGNPSRVRISYPPPLPDWAEAEGPTALRSGPSSLLQFWLQLLLSACSWSTLRAGRSLPSGSSSSAARSCRRPAPLGAPAAPGHAVQRSTMSSTRHARRRARCGRDPATGPRPELRRTTRRQDHRRRGPAGGRGAGGDGNSVSRARRKRYRCAYGTVQSTTVRACGRPPAVRRGSTRWSLRWPARLTRPRRGGGSPSGSCHVPA